MSYFNDLLLRNTRTTDDDWYDRIDYHMACQHRPAPYGAAIPDWRPYEAVPLLSDAELEEVINEAAELSACAGWGCVDGCGDCMACGESGHDIQACGAIKALLFAEEA